MNPQERLRLEHIAPYLPYGLEVPTENNQIREMVCQFSELSHDINSHVSVETVLRKKFKPLLKPLSELTRNELIDAGFDSHIDYLTHELQDPKNKTRLGWNGQPLWRVEHAPYEMVVYLFKNHFDVFGLISKGLAIDFNQLKLTDN